MEDYRRDQIKLLIAVVSIFLIGTLGYYFIEDEWTLLDALYMVVITITTVGFGEIHELSSAGRVFTIFLLLLGLGTAATFVTYLARFVIEGELKGVFRRKKMQSRIQKIRDHYIVCGHGRTGRTICLKLHEAEIPFVVIESNQEGLALAEQRGYLTVNGNAAQDMALLAAGIDRASGMVTCISDDAATLYIALAARELNPNIHIIAQGDDPAIEARLIRAGADTVVYPPRLGGEQIARLIAQQCGVAPEAEVLGQDPGVMGYYLRIFRHFGDREITVDEAVASAGAVHAVALRTGDGKEIDAPSGETAVTKQDSVVMLVRTVQTGPDAKTPRRAEIAWSDEMHVGVAAIDEQHRSLVMLANEFQEALSTGHGREKIAQVFDRLLDYTVEHFKDEEKLMRKHGYPGADQQVLEHRAFTTDVMALNKDKRYVFPENVGDFLNSWLSAHIMGIDKELGRFLNGQDVH